MREGSVLPSKIIVKEIVAEEKVTDAGIVIIAPRKNPQTAGIVVLTGSGTAQVPMVVKVGQTVLYTPLSGQRFELDGEPLVLLDQSSILFFYS